MMRKSENGYGNGHPGASDDARTYGDGRMEILFQAVCIVIGYVILKKIVEG